MVLIDRQAAIDAIHEDAEWLAAQGSDWQVARMERDKSILKSLPTVQPKRGKWIPEYKTTYYNGYYKIPSYCSCCKDYYTQSPEEMKFCPNCGAYMIGEDDDTD